MASNSHDSSEWLFQLNTNPTKQEVQLLVSRGSLDIHSQNVHSTNGRESDTEFSQLCHGNAPDVCLGPGSRRSGARGRRLPHFLGFAPACMRSGIPGNKGCPTDMISAFEDNVEIFINVILRLVSHLQKRCSVKILDLKPWNLLDIVN